MPYIGADDIKTGTTTATDLERDAFIEVVASFTRANKILPLIYKKEVPLGAKADTFVIMGKEDTLALDKSTTYARGTQVEVTDGTRDEITITLDRPIYVARRLDAFEVANAKFDAVKMEIMQMGQMLAAKLDRKAASTIEAASLATTNIANNGVGAVVVNVDIANAALTINERGNALVQAIYAGRDKFRNNDDYGQIFVLMRPENLSMLVQSDRLVNKEFTTENGGLDLGNVYMVAGAVIIETNNLPATAGLEALMFTSQAVGMVTRWGIKMGLFQQPDFLDATLATAYYANGMAPLRNQSAVSVKSA